MERLSFFTPVTYQPIPDVLFNKSPSTIVKEWADEFFVWKNGPRAFVIDVNQQGQIVQLVNCETSQWKTALKLALLATPIFPLMLIIKLCTRIRHYFHLHVSDYVPYKAERDEFEPIFYQNHSSIKPEEITRRYTEICNKQGLVYQNASPLQKHSIFFADQDGNFSQGSIQKGLERLHCKKIISFIISNRIFNGISMVMKTTTPSFSLKDITKAMHPSDTKVFNNSGAFDENQFKDMVKKFAIPKSLVISAENVSKLIQANHTRDSAKANADTGTEASTGEFRLMFNLFSDCALVDKFGNTTQAITAARLKSLYTEGPMLFEEVAASSPEVLPDPDF